MGFCRVWDGCFCIEEDNLKDTVGFRMKNSVCKMIKAVRTSLECVPLHIGIVKGALKPLSAEIALKLVGVDIVDVRHFSYYCYFSYLVFCNSYIKIALKNMYSLLYYPLSYISKIWT